MPLYGRRMILLRHGQSEFNLHFGATRRDPGIIDPRLTALGHTQAQEAAQQLAGQGIERIIVSPYTRALQTARPVAAALGLPVTIDPIVRERYAFACDIGSPRAGAGTRLAGPRFRADRGRLVAGRGRTGACHRGPGGPLPRRSRPPPRLGQHAGHQPLGLHSQPDRPERRQRPVAALRPDRTGTGTAGLAGVRADPLAKRMIAQQNIEHVV